MSIRWMQDQYPKVEADRIEGVYHLGGMPLFVHKMWMIIAVGCGIIYHDNESEFVLIKLKT